MLLEFAPSPMAVNASTLISYMVNFFSSCNSLLLVVSDVVVILLFPVTFAIL